MTTMLTLPVLVDSPAEGWHPAALARDVGAHELHVLVAGVPAVIRRTFSGELVAWATGAAYVTSLEIKELDDRVWLHVGSSSSPEPA